MQISNRCHPPQSARSLSVQSQYQKPLTGTRAHQTAPVVWTLVADRQEPHSRPPRPPTRPLPPFAAGGGRRRPWLRRPRQPASPDAQRADRGMQASACPPPQQPGPAHPAAGSAGAMKTATRQHQSTLTASPPNLPPSPQQQASPSVHACASPSLQLLERPLLVADE